MRGLVCHVEWAVYERLLSGVRVSENVFEPGQQQDGFDRLYVPQIGYTTGDLDIHDMAVDRNGRLVFVNTLFGCLATFKTHKLKPLGSFPSSANWPAEDRCH